MACCILTAYVMNRLIKACEVLDLKIINIRYNQFDDGPPQASHTSSSDDTFITSEFAVEGMTCAACTGAIESAVSGLKGVHRLSVSLPLARAVIVHRLSCASISDIIKSIEGAGYNARLGQRTAKENLELTQHSKELKQLRNAFSSATSISSAIFAIEWVGSLAMLLTYRHILYFMTAALGTWVQLVDASWVHEGAWSRGFTRLTMDTLISLSLLLGLALSFFNLALFRFDSAQTYFSSGAFLTTVIIGGRYLDHLLRRRSASNLADLYRLQTESTMVRVRGRENAAPVGDEHSRQSKTVTAMPAALIRLQDEIIIEQGAVVPCDCYVIEGRSMVDQSTMTGESVPVNKGPGEFLMSGTRNLSYELVAIVTKEQQDSSLEQLVASISSATETHSQERGSDSLTSYFVRIILFISVVGFGWTFWRSDRLSLFLRVNVACERAMAILASACPCALGLAAPSAAMASIDVAWTRGVILKGGLETIDILTKLRHIVMDKTGTLTTGKLSVAESTVDLGATECMLICAAEHHDAQAHPVAQTIFQWAFSHLNERQRREQNKIELCGYLNEPGKGVSCQVRLPSSSKWHAIHIGTASYLLEHSISLHTSQPSTSISPETTTVHIAFNQIHITTLILHDTIRPEAPAVISHLKSSFNLSVTMLTGDLPAEAARVSNELAIPVLSSQTLPHEKAAFIQQLKANGNTTAIANGGSGNKVAMLGDGINDTPALATADLGIFLSPSLASNTSSPLPQQSPVGPQSSSSSVILTSPTLTRLPEILAIAHKTASAAKFIRRWAVGYNVLAVALAMGMAEGLGARMGINLKIDAARAGSMMALSSVSVLGWGLWLRRELGRVSFKMEMDGDMGTTTDCQQWASAPKAQDYGSN